MKRAATSPAPPTCLSQAVELRPDFAAAWFALGDLREKLADRTGAIEAFGNAHKADPQDRHGAGLRLVRLSAGEHPMTQAYVRSVYDQYARQFDDALAGLSYRGPELLVSALEDVCRDSGRRMRFGAMLDLGCGTGLAGAALRPFVDWLVGIDLSEAMIAQARGKILYDKLVVAELTQFLQSGDRVRRALYAGHGRRCLYLYAGPCCRSWLQ